ncbi:MAG: alpha/beta fold hydrolase [Planctomycetes bacterium]|nr:alpha/beta fold hydrolase [Planctomycetota bacterium]
MTNSPDDTFTLKGADGAKLTGDVYLPANDSPPLVIVIHGFKGFKDWGFFPWLGRRLADSGLAAACINLSHNGIGENYETFERLDLFERDTWSKRVYDMTQVLDAAQHGLLTDKAQPNPGRLGILGHSMGGGLALLMAAKDQRVRSVVTLAGVNRANRLPMEAVTQCLHDLGHVPIENGRTGQIMRIGKEFFDELKQHGEAFDIKAAAAKIETPWLLIQGSGDETVPLEEAQDLLSVAGEQAKLLVIEDATHTFGAVHPFAGVTPHLEQCTDATIAHFKASL